jgi:hypothetical protein
MPEPLTFDEFDPAPNVKERKSAAETTVAEAEAPNAPRKSAADTAKAEADARKAAADADIAERKAAATVEAAEDKETGAAAAKTQTALDMMNYLGQIQAVRDAISTGRATGPFAQLTGGVFSSDAADLQAQLEALKSPIVLKALQDARKGSAAGATGFGALVNRELNLLASKLGTLDAKAKRETLLRTLEGIEQQYRRSIAVVAGYDPDTPEGAVLAGLEPPEGTEPPIPEGEIGAGEWASNPELRGVDAAVTSMVKAGRSPEQIRAWLNQYQEGLGDKAANIEANIQYFKQTGKDPGVTIERSFTPSDPTLISQLADNPVGAGIVAAGDQALSGFTSELAAGELSGPEYEKNAAVQRGLRAKYPTASAVGDVAGGVGTMLAGAYGGIKAGMRLPSFLEGAGQEALYGFGSGEPNERLANAAFSATTAPVTNLIGKPVSDIAGNLMRGADPKRVVLAEKYGINLTPGQLTGREGTERTVAGLPIAGPQVSARRNESLEQFNKATFDEALAPLGASTNGVGQRGVAEAQQIVSDAYEQALGGRTFQIDTDFLQVVQGKPYADLVRMKGNLGPKAAGEVDRILREINNGGAVDGRAWQQARRQLVDLQGNPEIKNDISGDAVRNSLGDIIDGFDDLVARQAPEALDMYTSANAAYRNLKIVERAVEYAPDGALFGPNNLRSATRINSQKFGGKSASARGDRPFNELTQAALDVVPNKVDDVTLSGRLIAPAAGAGGFGAIAATSAFANPEKTDKDEDPGFVPPWMLAAGLGAGVAALPYSRFGNRAIGASMLGGRSDRQRMLGDLIQNYAPAALRGAVLRSDSEMGAPMPAEFDYASVGAPELRTLMEQAAANTDAMAPIEGPVGGFEADLGGAPVMIGGRPVRYDEATGKYYDEETGEEMVGYKRGGQVKKQTSWYDDMVMAASRKGNDLAGAAADLFDRYAKPADAVAWIAENVEGRSPAEVAKIRRNLQPIRNTRSLVEAGAAENERRFARAGGLGARRGDEVVAPVRVGAATYRPADIPRAVVSETPRAIAAARDYVARSTPSGMLRDARRGIAAGAEAVSRDPYGMAFDGLFYAAPQTAIAAAPFDFAAMRESSQMLAPYTDDKEAMGAKRMVDALSVLPLAAPMGARRIDPRSRQKAGSLAAKRKGR